MSEGETSIQTRPSCRKVVSTRHCMLENVSDLHVNKRQKDTTALGLLKKEEERKSLRRMANCDFLYFPHYVHKLHYYSIIAMLHTYLIGI